MSAADGPTINADLMDLLPQAERDVVVEDAVSLVNKRFERRIVMLVGADDFKTAKTAAKSVAKRLTESGKFQDLRLDHDPDLIRHVISFYLPLRFQMLDDLARNQLRAGNEAAFEHAVLMRYFNPQSAINSSLIEKDPLFLLPRFLEQRATEADGRPELEDGYLTVKSGDKFYILLTGDLSGSPFSISLQRQLMPLLGDIRTDLPRQFQSATFLMAGTLPFAAAGTNSAIDETSTVGLGSLLGIILILIAIFRSPRPFVLTSVSIVLGCLGGFAACLAVFGEVHLLTLAFGSSLVGISVDYSLHYFCERFRFTEDWMPQSALRHIFPGITLGLITTVMGFAGLFFAPFPGMQGMAVFSSVGLCIAYGSVVICYPYFTQGLARPGFEKPLEWMRAYAALWRGKRDWKAWAAVAALAVLSVVGCLRLVANDDVRLLQTPDAGVMAEQKRVQAIIGQNLASQYFVVEGRDAADFLEREERLTEKLRALRKSGQLTGYVAISDFIASPQRQNENRALLAPLIMGKQNTLDRIARQIGLPDPTRDAYVAAFLESKRAPPTGLRQWLANPVSDPYRQLWLGPSKRGVVGVVGLRGANDLDALRALANSGPLVHFVDPAGEISGLFSQYRRQTTWRTIISYGVVMLLLLARYGVGGGLLVMAIPVIAAIVSLSVLGLLGEAINLFNVMALLLVLGIGVDYALFFRETGTENPATLLAIALSSATTLLAFGLLALSATTAIHSFGLTILVGILVASLLSPMAGWKARAAPAENSERRQ